MVLLHKTKLFRLKAKCALDNMILVVAIEIHIDLKKFVVCWKTWQFHLTIYFFNPPKI